MNQYASNTFGHVLVLFKRGCVGDGSHRSVSICAYAILYESLFHIGFRGLYALSKCLCRTRLFAALTFGVCASFVGRRQRRVSLRLVLLLDLLLLSIRELVGDFLDVNHYT